MKVIYFVFLLVFAAAVGLFAYHNNRDVAVTYLDTSLAKQIWEVPFPALMAGTYLLGMLSGWTVVGLLRRSWRNVVEEGDRR